MSFLGRLLLLFLLIPALGCVGMSGLERREPTAQWTKENPLFVPQAQDPQYYQKVFDTVYEVMQEYFPIASSNMYAGQIVAGPFISAGVFDWVALGGYDAYELFESTTQTIIRRPLANITPAESGGYFIDVQVWKELENRQTQQVQSFGTLLGNSNRGTNRNAPTPPQTIPISLGRDTSLEQAIIAKLKLRL